jgi:hypothetical protein
MYCVIVQITYLDINAETGDKKQKPVIKKDRISPVHTTCSTTRSPTPENLNVNENYRI